MKQWIALITCLACGFSAISHANGVASVQPAQEPLETTAIAAEEQPPKQVGKAAVDGSNAAKSSNTGKYILAASAIAVGVTALILVSRNHGHHHSHAH